MAGRRVYITGIGVISPVGIGAETFLENIIRGVSGIGPLTRFDGCNYSSRVAGQVNDFDPVRYLHPKKVAWMYRATQFSVAASKMAVEDAGLQLDRENPDRWAVITGTSNADFEAFAHVARTLHCEGVAGVDPAIGPPSIQISTAAAVTVELRFHCEAMTLSAGCCSGLYSLGEALRQIRTGQIDAALVGGTEAPIIPSVHALLSNAHALSTRNNEPARASRPFDRDRDGYVIGEGAAYFVLEEESRAAARGAELYAEVAGYGATTDAFSLVRMYEGHEYLARAMAKALSDAGLRPDQVDYVSAHGSSGVTADRKETRAIKTALGEQARRVQISSIKSMIGQAIGSACAMQAAATALMLKNGVLHPTINLEERDPECDLDYIALEARESVSRVALVNAMGMGGTNSSLVLLRAGKGAAARRPYVSKPARSGTFVEVPTT
ncbi:MAG TPA: beta-ketoacyl-[acyl-carrier-protein] synthase family protein [Planctomycetota bacterium]|nr:beta-ketoacyl-[acyl-carrier-protein] synthase family protein [Planctomycetota bacterium]